MVTIKSRRKIELIKKVMQDNKEKEKEKVKTECNVTSNE